MGLFSKLFDPNAGEIKRLQKIVDKIDSFEFEGEVKEAVDAELEKFALLDPSSSEFSTVRNYLDTIASLPWGKASQDFFDIEKAKAILEKRTQQVAVKRIFFILSPL